MGLGQQASFSEIRAPLLERTAVEKDLLDTLLNMLEQPTQTLSLKAAYAFGAQHGLEREVTDIREMVIEWDSSYTSSLRRGYIIALFEQHGLFEAFKKQYWPFGNTPTGETKRRRYLRIKADYEAFLAGRGPEPGGDNGTETSLEEDQPLEFALEAHLRDFLAKNLDRVESGLRLYSTADSDGVEFSVDGGRIDLLAVDRAGRFVVIELKLSQGRNRTLGQLLIGNGKRASHSPSGRRHPTTVAMPTYRSKFADPFPNAVPGDLSIDDYMAT